MLLLFSVNQFYETGVFDELTKKIEEDLLASIKKGARLFTSLEDFLSEFNKIEDVRLDNYESLFLGGLSFLSFLLVIFVLNRYKNKIKKFISKLFRQISDQWFRKLFKFILKALYLDMLHSVRRRCRCGV